MNNASFLLQWYSVLLLLRDFNNTDLMQELQKQDNEYLDKIIKQNEIIINQNKEILEILNERRDKNE